MCLQLQRRREHRLEGKNLRLHEDDNSPNDVIISTAAAASTNQSKDIGNNSKSCEPERCGNSSSGGS